MRGYQSNVPRSVVISAHSLQSLTPVAVPLPEIPVQPSPFSGAVTGVLDRFDQRPQSPSTNAAVLHSLPAVPPQPSPFSLSASSNPGSNLPVPVPQSVPAVPVPPTSIPQSSSGGVPDAPPRDAPCPSPFTSTAPAVSPLGIAPPSVSSPFVDLRGPPSVGARAPTGSHLEAGPVRLTRFVDMSLENYYATVNGMVLAGAFEHVGHASVRVEGATAWGVWLRVDYWPTALGRHPRLRCGVLYHVANRTLSFHGVGRDAVQFLVPLFESWTFSSLPQLPSIRTSGSSVPPLDDPALRVPTTGNVPTTPRSVPAPVSASSAEVVALLGLVHRLVDLCESNQREIRSLRDEFSQLGSWMISRFPAPLPSLAAPSDAPHMVTPPLPPPGASPPAPPPPIAHEDPRPDRPPSINQCRRSGCSSRVPHSCPVGFCQTHCTSSRCSLHSTLTPLPLDADVVVPGDALPWFLVLVTVGIASLIAPAFDVHCIAGVSVNAPLWIVQQMQTQDVWLVLAVRIALTPSAVQSVAVRS